MTRPAVMALAAGLTGCLLIAGADRKSRPPKLVFNTTASAPIGFYWVDQTAPSVGEIAVVQPPPHLARWMAQRRYLPMNVPLLKTVAAVGGARVCSVQGVVSIDGVETVRALERDRLGRRLSAYAGCRRLAGDEVFLLNAATPASLDSRYFGPLKRDAIVGRARPLWTRER